MRVESLLDEVFIGGDGDTYEFTKVGSVHYFIQTDEENFQIQFNRSSFLPDNVFNISFRSESNDTITGNFGGNVFKFFNTLFKVIESHQSSNPTAAYLLFAGNPKLERVYRSLFLRMRTVKKDYWFYKTKLDMIGGIETFMFGRDSNISKLRELQDISPGGETYVRGRPE